MKKYEKENVEKSAMIQNSLFAKHSIPRESGFPRNLEDHAQSSVYLHDLGCQLWRNRTQVFS